MITLTLAILFIIAKIFVVPYILMFVFNTAFAEYYGIPEVRYIHVLLISMFISLCLWNVEMGIVRIQKQEKYNPQDALGSAIASILFAATLAILTILFI